MFYRVVSASSVFLRDLAVQALLCFSFPSVTESGSKICAALTLGSLTKFPHDLPHHAEEQLCIVGFQPETQD